MTAYLGENENYSKQTNVSGEKVNKSKKSANFNQ